MKEQSFFQLNRSRDDGIEVTLLPIPNRKVKVYSADGTAWETVWQSRTLRGKIKSSCNNYFFLFYIRTQISSGLEDDIPKGISKKQC